MRFSSLFVLDWEILPTFMFLSRAGVGY